MWDRCDENQFCPVTNFRYHWIEKRVCRHKLIEAAALGLCIVLWKQRIRNGSISTTGKGEGLKSPTWMGIWSGVAVPKPVPGCDLCQWSVVTVPFLHIMIWWSRPGWGASMSALRAYKDTSLSKDTSRMKLRTLAQHHQGLSCPDLHLLSTWVSIEDSWALQEKNSDRFVCFFLCSKNFSH